MILFPASVFVADFYCVGKTCRTQNQALRYTTSVTSCEDLLKIINIFNYASLNCKIFLFLNFFNFCFYIFTFEVDELICTAIYYCNAVFYYCLHYSLICGLYI